MIYKNNIYCTDCSYEFCILCEQNIFTFENHTHETTMDLTLAKTIEGLSSYVKECNPDMIVIHGDRVEALAGAVVGSLNNILVSISAPKISEFGKNSDQP